MSGSSERRRAYSYEKPTRIGKRHEYTSGGLVRLAVAPKAVGCGVELAFYELRYELKICG